MKTIVDFTTAIKTYFLGKDTAAKQAVEANIADVETDATSASKAYNVGEQLILNDILYDVTASIIAGDDLTVGTNIAAASKLSSSISGKQDQIEVTTMPTASAAYLGKVLIYIGTTGTYTSGQSYQCVEESGSYSWQATSGGTTSAANVTYDNTSSGMTADDVQEAVDELNSALTNEAITRANADTALRNRIDNLVESVCYGFHINGNESDPTAMVTYLADAVGMTPAAMDYTNSKFDYGSWEDAFFMPRPCMLKSDGTVDYYLDPNDYSLQEDGVTASDIANTAYDGNAMMEWGQNDKKIWLKIVPKDSGKSADVFIANAQLDDDYHDYSFHDSDGVSQDHFYTAIYNGSVISSKMRSLSGQTVSKTLTGTAEITAAKLNNASTKEKWNIECMADRLLINMLLILMGKSTDTQTVFGQGANSGGSEAVNDTFTTGEHNAKGLFYGTNSGAVSSNSFANIVKIFGMENYYGFQWRRTNGYILADGVQKVKLTYGQEDGSTVDGYNTDGSGYVTIADATPSGTSGGYISEAKFTEQGMFGKVSSGSASTYYCDGQWYNNSGSRFARFGGYSSRGALVGAFCCDLGSAVSGAGWYVGAALSCR